MANEKWRPTECIVGVVAIIRPDKCRRSSLRHEAGPAVLEVVEAIVESLTVEAKPHLPSIENSCWFETHMHCTMSESAQSGTVFLVCARFRCPTGDGNRRRQQKLQNRDGGDTEVAGRSMQRLESEQ